jgi:metallo-beta-lactamase family protein
MTDKASLSLEFLGAAGTVTGSRYLLTSDSQKLLVDCGMFQGVKHLREQNWQPFPIPAESIDAVLLTHAHLDHSGYLPALVAQGFSGPVYCTDATRQLCEILLLDAAHLQEEEAAYRNRKGRTRHQPALPLFTTGQARNVLQQFRALPLHGEHAIGSSQVSLHPNGHILGSCSVDLVMEGRRITFSGDLGRSVDLQMPAPEAPRACDYLVTESTYGDRLHPQRDVEATIADVVSNTAQHGGSILIPSFAVGRAQLVIHILSKLKRAGRIPTLPVYLDSPMAIAATRAVQANRELSRFSARQMSEMVADTQLVETAAQSQALGLIQVPMVIISASGMATGGRVLHHLKRMLPNHRDAILFAGYQAPGTRGDRLVSGEPSVKIHGRPVEVRAQIESLGFLSAHADYEELLDWFRKMPVAPLRTFITHGEQSAAEHLQQELQDQLGWRAVIPGQGDVVNL